MFLVVGFLKLQGFVTEMKVVTRNKNMQWFEKPGTIQKTLNTNPFDCYLGRNVSLLKKKRFLSFRFTAIAYPYHYHANWDRKKSTGIIILFWLFAILWTLCVLWYWGTNSIKTFEIFTVTASQGRCVNTNTLFYVSSYSIYVSGVLVMTICYVFILKVTIHHIKVIHSTTSTNISSERKLNSKTQRRNKELKATKSMAIVYFAFLFCWFPLLIINVIISIDKMFFYKMLLENEDLFLFIYYTFIVILPALNFMINPVIYSFTNKSFRNGMKSVFRNIKVYQFNNNSVEPTKTLHTFSMTSTKRN